jgi:putative DNA primase/helicase
MTTDNIVKLAALNDAPHSPENSDDALALEFTRKHAGDRRYVAEWNRWLIWDGKRWCLDRTTKAFDDAREICRAASAIAERGTAKALASRKTVAAVVAMASSDRQHAALIEQWDADYWLLNTPGGTIDLRTGILRPHCHTDYLTKSTAVASDDGCPTPVWLTFLDRVTAGDRELVAFLQRMAGYALTGSTQEHALFFHHGAGANGKSTFNNVLSGIAGDYHRTAPIETFIASPNERHPTDLAGLRGARLVTAVETEEGRRWDETKIKVLTGGDAISARFMRQDFFEYVPQFKLMIIGNHRPSLRSVDEAIRRRLHLVPWTVVIPPDERDKHLGEKLRAEWPGILAWLIKGCMQWQQIGLAPPVAVTAATDAYMEAEDALTAWVEEWCERDASAWERTITLYEAWAIWCKKTGEYPGTIRRFSQTLEARGQAFGAYYQRDRKKGRGFRGLRLIGDALAYTP